MSVFKDNEGFKRVDRMKNNKRVWEAWWSTNEAHTIDSYYLGLQPFKLPTLKMCIFQKKLVMVTLSKTK